MVYNSHVIEKTHLCTAEKSKALRPCKSENTKDNA